HRSPRQQGPGLLQLLPAGKAGNRLPVSRPAGCLFLSSLGLAVKNPVAYALASLLAGYYLLATAAFDLAPVAEVALLLSTPPLFALALRRIRGDVPKVLEVSGAALAVTGIGFILAPRLALTGGAFNARLIGDSTSPSVLRVGTYGRSVFELQ